MPYNPSKPPAKLNGLTDKQKRQWCKVFNSAYKQYDGDEAKAHASAWSAVNKEKKSKKKSFSESNFVKMAEMSNEDKEKVKIYWKQLWGSDFANALVGDNKGEK